MSQFQEILEHVIKLGGFSATMESVFENMKYAILVMAVEITAMSRGQLVLFVVGVLDSFLAFLRTFYVGQQGKFHLKSTVC